MNNIPWFAILGNHDWHQSPQAQLDFGQFNPRWIMDDFFYTRKMLVGGKKVVFLFCSLDLIFYGYDGFDETGLSPDNIGTTSSNNNMRNHFRSYGWVPENDTITKQLNWIENMLKENNDADYLFVTGHYNMIICGDELRPSLDPLKALFDKYRVSAYIFGHSHILAHAIRNSTFYLQSGAGGRSDECLQPSNENGDWVKDKIYGFANVKVNSTDAIVEYYDKNMVKLEETGFKPRNVTQRPFKSRKNIR